MFPIFSPTKILDSIILMQIVVEGPQYGYALSSIMEEKFDWKPSQTAVYNSLKSLENEALVAVEERIENGRVQKIYSITEKGRKYFSEMHQELKKQMKKDFTQFFSFVQMVGDIDAKNESNEFQLHAQSILKNIQEIYRLTFYLIRTAPKETQEIIENTVHSLNKVATKLNIQIPNEESVSEQKFSKGA